VIVDLGLKLRLHIRELVFQRREADDNVMAFPEVALGTGGGRNRCRSHSPVL
jgi:hypothetical protein